MDYEIKEMIVWLLLEYRARNSKLNANGLYALAELRGKWNIEKADEEFALFCEEEDSKENKYD